MKVTSSMIHPEIRAMGVAIRRVYRFRRREQFVRCNQLMDRFMKGRTPRGLRVEACTIPTQNKTAMRVLICSPQHPQPDAAGVLWIHGGGYALGCPDQELGYARRIVENTNAVVVLPDYTLSVDRPYPAALEDCYAALVWMRDHATELGINPSQLFVAGESAGGGLTAALTLYARDRGEVRVAFQMPLYPMLDCRMQTDSMRDNDAPVWDYKANEIGWRLYLGDLYGSDDIPYTASPSLATDITGLPPTYTFVGTIEPFHDETVAYIHALQAAGIPAKCDEYEGCYHAFDMFGSHTAIGRKATRAWIAELQYAAAHYYAEQPAGHGRRFY